MSDGLGWTTAPSSRPIFDNSGRADADFALPAFLPCLPLWCRSASSSCASADCRFAEFRCPWRQIGELIFAPRVSRECTSGCIEVRERGTDCCAPYLGGSFCGMHPQHMCVCACYCMGWVAVGIAACARQLEWKQHCPRPTTHQSGGLSSTHENIFPPPCFIFNQTFVALTVRFQSDLSSLVPCGSNVQLGSG